MTRVINFVPTPAMSSHVPTLMSADVAHVCACHCRCRRAAMSKRRGEEEGSKLTRIAVVNSDRCKPKRCRQECKRSCPVVRMGKLCIEVTPNDKIAIISEELCIGCGICIKVGRWAALGVDSVAALKVLCNGQLLLNFRVRFLVPTDSA